MAWSQERFSFEGRRYQYQDVAVYPKPVQQPTPPLWLAAWSEAGARRAGRLGDAYVSDPIYNLAAIKRFAEEYRTAASSARKDAEAGEPEVVLMREFLCAETRQEAVDRYAEGILGTYRYYLSNGAFSEEWDPWIADLAGPAEMTFEQVAADRVIFGSPDDCAEQLEHWVQETGASHVQLTIPQASNDQPDQPPLEAIRFAGEQVVARLSS